MDRNRALAVAALVAATTSACGSTVYVDPSTATKTATATVTKTASVIEQVEDVSGERVYRMPKVPAQVTIVSKGMTVAGYPYVRVSEPLDADHPEQAYIMPCAVDQNIYPGLKVGGTIAYRTVFDCMNDMRTWYSDIRYADGVQRHRKGETATFTKGDKTVSPAQAQVWPAAPMFNLYEMKVESKSARVTAGPYTYTCTLTETAPSGVYEPYSLPESCQPDAIKGS